MEIPENNDAKRIWHRCLFVMLLASILFVGAILKEMHRLSEEPGHPHVHVDPMTGLASSNGIVELPSIAQCGIAYPHIHTVISNSPPYEIDEAIGTNYVNTQTVKYVDIKWRVWRDWLPPIPICTKKHVDYETN